MTKPTSGKKLADDELLITRTSRSRFDGLQYGKSAST